MRRALLRWLLLMIQQAEAPEVDAGARESYAEIEAIALTWSGKRFVIRVDEVDG